MQVKATTIAGEVISGIGIFVLANVPAQPAIPTNDATVTNSE